MLNPEDFRRQLSEVLAAKQKAEAEAAATERLRQQQGTAQAREERTQARATEKQRNQAVLELDSQLPIGEYLEVLKNKIAPLEYVRKFGPKKGKIGYSFIYGGGVRSLGTFSETSIAGDRCGNTHAYTVKESVIRIARDVVGLTLNYLGTIRIAKRTCIIGLTSIRNKNGYVLHPNSINPSNWNVDFSNFDVTSPEGLQKFAQGLTDFYVGFKSGK